jgi:enoyl-CoA hydratase
MKINTLIYSQKSNIGIIGLNRPQRMNAVNETLYLEIQQVLEQIEKNEDIRALIITGSVYRKGTIRKPVFCAGADLKDHAAGRRNKIQKREYIRLAHETTEKLFEYPKPVIAAINGPARGAGVELALNCDFILMADSATLAFTETGLGTFVGGGVTRHLPLIVGLMKAKELIYTGKIIDGIEAMRLGLSLLSVPQTKLMSAAMTLAGVIAEKAPVSMKIAKHNLNNSMLINLKQTLKNETEAILDCMETEDWHEGVRSFNEKRKPIFKGE